MKPIAELLWKTPSGITLAPIERPRLQLLQEVLEKWKRPKESDEGKAKEKKRSKEYRVLLDKLAEDEHLGFLCHLLDTNLNAIPLRSLLRVILDRFHADLAVLEDPYLEMEFWDTYAYFHSRSFLDRRKQCWRLHFFRSQQLVDKPQPDDLVRHLYAGTKQEEIKKAGFEYLGFATIRPTTSFCLGRTAVPFDEDPGGRAELGEDELELNGVSYCKGKSEQVANVCATKLTVDTVPFLQQDPVVGMCATASLWVTSQVLASKFDLHKFPYIDISRQATQPSLAPFVVTPPDSHEDFAHGLSIPEICGALLRTGAVPLIITPKRFRDRGLGRAHVHDQLYTFVESELPVIVTLAEKGSIGHAVTAVGHLQPDVQTMDDIKGCSVAQACPRGSAEQYVTSLVVKRFYVHNDNYGPFDRLDFVDPTDPKESKYKKWLCPIRLSREKQKTYDLFSLVIPVPPYVKNRPDFVLQDASVRFAKLFYGETFKKVEDEFKVLWRMLLVKGSRFKQSLVEREWPPDLIEAYAKLHLPKYVWLCEISLFRENSVADCLGPRAKRLVHGEFVFDTTTPHYRTHAVAQRLGPFFITDSQAPSLDEDARVKLMRDSRLKGVPLFKGLPCFTGTAQD